MKNVSKRKRKSVSQHSYLLGSRTKFSKRTSMKGKNQRVNIGESYLTRKKSKEKKKFRKLVPLDENVEKMMKRTRNMLFSEKIDCFGNVKDEFRKLLKTETDLRSLGLQKDYFYIDRLTTPRFAGPEPKRDIATQVPRDCKELYDFDLEAEPVLQVLVARSIELAQLEIYEEERSNSLRQKKWSYEIRRRARLTDLQKLLFHKKRLDFEKEERKRERELRLRVERHHQQKIFCGGFVKEKTVHKIFESAKQRLKVKKILPVPKNLGIKKFLDQRVGEKVFRRVVEKSEMQNLFQIMATKTFRELKKIHKNTIIYDKQRREKEEKRQKELKEKRKNELLRERMQEKLREKIESRRALLEELKPMIEERQMLKKEDLAKTHCFGYWNLLDFKHTPGQFAGRKSKPMHSDLFGLAYDMMISVTLLYQKKILSMKPGDEMELIPAGPYSTQFDYEPELEVIESQHGMRGYSQNSFSQEGKNHIPRMRDAGQSGRNAEYSENEMTWEAGSQMAKKNQVRTTQNNKIKGISGGSGKGSKVMKGSESEPGLVTSQNTFSKRSQLDISPPTKINRNLSAQEVVSKKEKIEVSNRLGDDNLGQEQTQLRNCPAILERALDKWVNKSGGIKFPMLLSKDLVDNLTSYEQILWQHLVAREMHSNQNVSKNGRNKKIRISMKFDREEMVKELQNSNHYHCISTTKNSALLVLTFYRIMTEKNPDFASKKRGEMMSLAGSNIGREVLDFRKWLDIENFLESHEFMDLLLRFEGLETDSQNNLGKAVDFKKRNPLLNFFVENGILSFELYVEYLKVVVKTRLKFLKNNFRAQIRKNTIRFKETMNNGMMDEKSKFFLK